MSSDDSLGKTQFTGTQIDLGEDLLEKTAVLRISPDDQQKTKLTPIESAVSDSAPEISSPDEINEQIASAQILLNEGLAEEAKKLLRKVLLSDPRNVLARQKLDEIHDAELKQLFGDEEPKRKKKKKKETSEPYIDPEEVMRQLDQDLGLGVFHQDDVTGKADALSLELELFQNKEAMEEYAAHLDQDVADLSGRDRIDLGIGFLEMGLTDIAIRQFQAAVQDPEQGLVACGLLAYALIISGRAFEASLVIEPILNDAELPADQKIDFMYLMGRAYTSMKKPQIAVQWFNQVKEIDPTYRDVGERLRA